MRYKAVKGIIFNNAPLAVGQIIEVDYIPEICRDCFIPLPDADKIPVVLPHKDKPAAWPNLYRLDIFTTGNCNINCGLCSQAEYRKSFGHLDLQVYKDVITQVANAGLKDISISYTGGEPTLWPDFKEAVRLTSEILPDIPQDILSNLSNFGMLDQLLESGQIRTVISNLANCNKTNAKALEEKYPDKVKLSHYGHLPLPRTAVWHALPASCHCPGVALMGEYIYACPNLFSLQERFNYTADQDYLKVHYKTDWISYYQKNEKMKYRNYLCMLCPSNAYVKKEITQDEKVMRYSSGI